MSDLSTVELELHVPIPPPSPEEVAKAERELAAIAAERSRRDGLRRLREAGIGYQAQFGRAQVVIRHLGRTFDYWPTTGKWRERDMTMHKSLIARHPGARRDGTGIDSLIEAVEGRT